ncbi:MAG: endonuclease, partial [Bacteroidales bacterium]|nr:endonuclease [Bacteroidales bacterium]
MKYYLLLKRAFILTVFFLFTSQYLFSQTPPDNLNGEQLKVWLKDNYYTGKHKTLGYDGARSQMYGYVDKKSDGKIYGVYSGFSVSASYDTGEVFNGGINCEHTIPQSFFGKQNPMVSDLHHLFSTHKDVNNTRSNYPFAEIDDSKTTKWMYLDKTQSNIPTENIDSYSEFANNTFEPREDHKGDVARAIFYFYTMYPTQAGDISKVGDINLFYQWHLQDPVDEWERTRNQRIAEKQGDLNPYVVNPDLIARAWGFQATNNVATPVFSQQSCTFSSPINITITTATADAKIYYTIDGAQPTINSTLYSAPIEISATTTLKAIAVKDGMDNSAIQSANYTFNTNSGNTSGGLFISEVSAGKIADVYHKYVELYNATDATIDLGAQNYYIGVETNATTTIGMTKKLEGSIAPGAVFIVCEVAQAAYGANYLVWSDFKVNGDDRVFLLKDGDKDDNIVDAFGVKGVPAQATDAWYYKYGYAVRNSNVIVSNSTFDVAQWTVKQTTEGITPGTHIVDGAVAPAFAVSVYPANNATNVAIDTDVKISFNNAITVPADLASIFTFKAGETAVNFTTTIDEAKKVITLKPSAALSYSTEYTFTVAAVKSEDGSESTEAITSKFTTEAELTLIAIKDIQTPASSGSDVSPLKDKNVWVEGAITAVYSKVSNGVTTQVGAFIQDSNNPYSGIYVYSIGIVLPSDNELKIGEVVSVKGIVDEYHNFTQIKNPTVEKINKTINITATELTLDKITEEYEGMLVKVTGTVEGAMNTYGEYKITDGTNSIQVDDKLYRDENLLDGTKYTFVGTIDYSFNFFKVLPRSADDVVAEKSTAINDNNIKFSLYPNPTTGMFVVRTQAGAANY